MNALQILLDRPENWNLVPRQESCIGMAAGASRRQILFRYRRGGLARHLNLMHRPVAGSTSWSVGVARFRGTPVNAFRKLIHLYRVTLGAFPGLHFGRCRYFMDVAVTRGASRFPEHSMYALCRIRGLIRVAGRALDFGNFCGMREILDRGVAIPAAEDPVHARVVLLRTDGNIRALFRFHSRLAMACQAGFVLFQGLRWFFLVVGKGGKTRICQENQQACGN